ncbi:MAG: hypothetical protein KF901_09770 [Myxococcales bacterium]|nr:hypothetical protein [Myxococcales bacterium]
MNRSFRWLSVLSVLSVRSALAAFSALSALSVVACETPVPPPDAPPDAPLGPGTWGEAAAELRVRVVDARTRAPLVGASVTSDDVTATTDARGEVVLASGDAVTARAEGFVTETFVGAEAGALTIALEPTTPRPTRRVRLTIPAWAALVAEEGDQLVARVQVARDRRIDADASPSGECLGADAVCEVMLEVSEGASLVFAELLRIDDALRPTVEEPVGLALGEVAEGALEASLARHAATLEVTLDPRLPGSPGGVDAVVGVPGVRVGERVMLYATPRADRTRFLVPALEGTFAGATLWAVTVGSGRGLTTRTVSRATPGEVPTAFPSLEPVSASSTRAGDRLSLFYDAPLATLISRDRVVRIFDRRASVPSEWLVGETTLVVTDAPRAPEGWDLDEVERSWARRVTIATP